MNPKQKQELINLLLDCVTMKEHDRRTNVVNDLPKDIYANIKRNDASKHDVANILNTCLGYSNGLKELIDNLCFYEDNSLAIQAVLAFVSKLESQQNDATPEVAPIQLPTPKPLPSVHEQVWPKDGKVMVHVPAGEFLYGENGEKGYLPEFWIDKTPVTNAEYARFVAETDYRPPEYWKGKIPPLNMETHPVVNVSWLDAQAYAWWAEKQLPSEQQWEKAARWIDGRIYPWGSTEPTEKLCNFNKSRRTVEWSESVTTPVGQYSPQGDSPYGCVDMSGNVKEWTASRYHKYHNEYVLRGGSGSDIVDFIRCYYRNKISDNHGNHAIGFRCVYVPTESPAA